MYTIDILPLASKLRQQFNEPPVKVLRRNTPFQNQTEGYFRRQGIKELMNLQARNITAQLKNYDIPFTKKQINFSRRNITLRRNQSNLAPSSTSQLELKALGCNNSGSRKIQQTGELKKYSSTPEKMNATIRTWMSATIITAPRTLRHLNISEVHELSPK